MHLFRILYCLRLTWRRHHRSLVVEEEELVLCGYERGKGPHGPHRERGGERQQQREREKEKVISSQIIPIVQIMMAYLVFCVWKRKGHGER
jgi:hypothetical protein